jgi:YesN/AraC family two-component response regulator
MKYEISNGDIILINEFDVHKFFFNSKDTAYKRYIVNFKKDYILPYLKIAGIDHIFDDLSKIDFTHATTRLRERNELKALFEYLVDASKLNLKALPNEFYQASIRSTLVLILIQIWNILSNSKPYNNTNKKSLLVRDIIQFIDNNYCSQIQLDQLANKFFINKFYMCDVFKEITNLSIMEYVQQRRVIEAQKLLKRDKEKKIIEVCFDCGFNNVQHFHRTFKKVTGTTPNQYRNM